MALLAFPAGMRITGGAARGIPLQVPRGNKVRPATDSLRQALFSSLSPLLPKARFLDLFAGSGSYGLEAFSRGATSGIFVEKEAKTANCIRKNIAAVCRSSGQNPSALRVVVDDALKWMPHNEEAFPDLIFIDPPYEIITELAPALFRHLSMITNRQKPLIIFETPGEITLTPENWTLVKRLGKGARHQPTLSIFSKSVLP